jgi:hypothetical protein
MPYLFVKYDANDLGWVGIGVAPEALGKEILMP